MPEIRSGSVTTAPTANTTQDKTPDYDRLFEGGLFPINVGIGYDETGADLYEISEFRNGLSRRGFERLDVANLSPEQLRERNLDPALIDADGTYFAKSFEHNGEQVTALLKYTDRNTENARERFGDGFYKRGLVMYGGHARYGSGPDFDEKESAEGNFVIGAPYNAHMGEILHGRPNALQAGELTDEYQLMFFAACKSYNYLDELRSLPANKSTENLDFIGSNSDLYWHQTSENLFRVLDSVMSGGGTTALKSTLEGANSIGFTFDGFEDN